MTEPKQQVDFTPAAGATKPCLDCQEYYRKWQMYQVEGCENCNRQRVPFFAESTGVRVPCPPSWGIGSTLRGCTRCHGVGWVAETDVVIWLDAWKSSPDRSLNIEISHSNEYLVSLSWGDYNEMNEYEQHASLPAAFAAAVERAVVASGGTLG